MKNLKAVSVAVLLIFGLTGCYTQLQHTQRMQRITDSEQGSGYSWSGDEQARSDSAGMMTLTMILKKTMCRSTTRIIRRRVLMTGAIVIFIRMIRVTAMVFRTDHFIMIPFTVIRHFIPHIMVIEDRIAPTITAGLVLASPLGTGILITFARIMADTTGTVLMFTPRSGMDTEAIPVVIMAVVTTITAITPGKRMTDTAVAVQRASPGQDDPGKPTAAVPVERFVMAPPDRAGRAIRAGAGAAAARAVP